MPAELIQTPSVPAPAELSARAVIVGCSVGAILAIANVYMGLKTGWNDSGNITSSLLGFALLRAWARGAATSRLRALAIGCGGAGLVAWFRDGRPSFIPQAALFPGRISGISASALSLGVALSPMMLAAGALVGLHLGVSVLVGSLVGWAGIA